GQGGTGGANSASGGGGGGGYYGGGGGGGGAVTETFDGFGAGGGGGGSSYSVSTASYTAGFQPGNGYVTLTYENGPVTDNSVKLFYLGTAVGDDKATSSEWDTVSETVAYGGIDDRWGYNLTPSVVNDPTFGVGLSATVA